MYTCKRCVKKTHTHTGARANNMCVRICVRVYDVYMKHCLALLLNHDKSVRTHKAHNNISTGLLNRIYYSVTMSAACTCGVHAVYSLVRFDGVWLLKL